MKKLILFAFLLPCGLFAQDIKKENQSKVEVAKNSSSAKAYFVDGKQVDYKTFIQLDVQLIDNVEVIKNDPKYPGGRVNVTLKK